MGSIEKEVRLDRPPPVGGGPVPPYPAPVEDTRSRQFSRTELSESRVHDKRTADVDDLRRRLSKFSRTRFRSRSNFMVEQSRLGSSRIEFPGVTAHVSTCSRTIWSGCRACRSSAALQPSPWTRSRIPKGKPGKLYLLTPGPKEELPGSRPVGEYNFRHYSFMPKRIRRLLHDEIKR